MKHIMKLLRDKITSKSLLTLLLFSLLAIGIWFLGPFLVFNNYSPLDEPNKRLYLITAIFFVWLLKMIFLNNKQVGFTAPTSRHPEFIKKLGVLEARLSGAIDFLKKTVITRHGKETSLFSLPWYFVIGPAHGGKTSLLANANINYILSKQFKSESLQSLAPNDTCDWWVTRDAVLIDVPSIYTTTSKINPRKPTIFSMLWKSLLCFTNKYRGATNIEGVIFTLPLAELLSSQQVSQREQIVRDLQRCVKDIKDAFNKEVACYIAVTKCDKLPGFIEFFGETSSEELQQAWGVTFNTPIQAEALLETFTERFSALIKRLNKQLIWRLHQERDPMSRPYIKDFPLQIERLHEVLAEIIKDVVGDQSLHLQGVFLTSALQANSATTSTTSVVASTPHALQLTQPPAHQSKAFFIKQFILHGITPSQHSNSVTKKTWRNSPRTAYGLSAAVLLFSFVLLGNDFRHSLAQTYAIKDNLTQYNLVLDQHTSLEDKLRTGLPLMDALHDAATHTTRVLVDYSDKAQVTAQAAYQQGLRTLVLPAIQHVFETYLQTTSNKNPDDLYAVLQAYLMLNEPQHIQREYIARMFTKISTNTLPPEQAQHLLKHLNIMLASNWQPLTLNNELIGKTRQQLSTLSPLQLSYVILKSISTTDSNQIIKLQLHLQNVLALTNIDAANIPQMYTADFFQQINNNMAQALREAQYGNWVLGDLTTGSMQLASIADLRSLYMTNYANVWENLLNHIRVNPPQNIDAMNKVLALLSSDVSPLQQLLQIVKQNTAFDPILSASPTLTQVNNLFTNTQTGTSVIKILQNISAAHVFLQTALSSKQSAFNLTLQRMKNPTSPDAIANLFSQATLTPEPVRSLLNTLGNQSWHFIFADAQQYLTSQWHATVGQPIAALATRFPLAIKAQNEINFNDFTKMYGSQGTFPNFYRENLQAFIDTSATTWTWKKVDNQQLAFSQDTLDKIQKALQIQQAFFPQNNNQLKVEFSLQPLVPNNEVKSFNLTINGQEVQYNHSTTPLNVTWPGDQKSQQTLLKIVTKNNKIYQGSVQGDWGLFKVVTETLQKSVNAQEVLLNLDLAGYKAKFLLSSHTPVNPFLYTNLQNLVLPEELA